MTPIQLRQKLLHQLNQLSEDNLLLVDEFLAFLEFKSHHQMHHKINLQMVNSSELNSILQACSTGQSLLENLKTLGTWDGDDFEACLQEAYDTRLPAKFDTVNPFD